MVFGAKVNKEITLKHYMIEAIVNSAKYVNDYVYQIHVLVDDELVVPEHIKKQYGIGNMIMLSLQSNQQPNPEFEYESGILSWFTTFNRQPFTVSVPVENIIAVIEPYSKQAIQFGIIQEQPTSEPTAPTAKTNHIEKSTEGAKDKGSGKPDNKKSKHIHSGRENPFKVIKGGKHE